MAVSIDEVTAAHLPGMVLTLEEVKERFPFLTADTDQSGYSDNAAAARDSIDPGDSAADLEASGRLNGYSYEFFDLEVLFGVVEAPDRPLGLTTSIDLFASGEAAAAFIRKQLEDYARLIGSEIEEGITLTSYEPASPLSVGEDTVAGRYGINIDLGGFIIEANAQFIGWRRGPLVVLVGIAAADKLDRSATLEVLARSMDRRINGVLAGEIVAETPQPTATPTPRLDPEGAALAEGYDLTAMLPTLEDLPQGVVVTFEGYSPGFDTVATYEREFEAEGLVFILGTSRVSNISATLELYASAAEASLPVRGLAFLPDDAVAQLFTMALEAQFGFPTENITISQLDIPPLGNVAVAYQANIDTDDIDLNGHLFFFARDRVAVQLFVAGIPGRLAVEDTLALAQFIDNAIVASSP